MGMSISQMLDTMIGMIQGTSLDDAFDLDELEGIRWRLRKAEKETWQAVCRVRMRKLKQELAAAGGSDGGEGERDG